MQPAVLPKSDSIGSRRPRWKVWLLLAPMLGWLAVFVLAPLGILFLYSFCERDELGQVVFTFSSENYHRVFDPIYVRILMRSIGLAGLTTAICAVVAYPAA